MEWLVSSFVILVMLVKFMLYYRNSSEYSNRGRHKFN